VHFEFCIRTSVFIGLKPRRTWLHDFEQCILNFQFRRVFSWAVKELQIRRRISHPQQSPDLNAIESIWQIIGQYLGGGHWRTEAEFKAAMEAAMEADMEGPKPRRTWSCNFGRCILNFAFERVF
jgi:hypothetical protein